MAREQTTMVENIFICLRITFCISRTRHASLFSSDAILSKISLEILGATLHLELSFNDLADVLSRFNTFDAWTWDKRNRKTLSAVPHASF